MKKSLQITGRVELTHKEISKSIIDFLKTEHQLATERLIYEFTDEQGNPIQAHLTGVVAYVHQSSEDELVPRFGKDPKKSRESPEVPVVRRNMGVNDTIRSILNEAFNKRGPYNHFATIPFKQLLESVIFSHPGMDDKKLYVYLYDRRQLPNIDWLPKEGKVIVKGVINH